MPCLVAWFQARSSGADPRHEVEAGSSNLVINKVTGYKGEYVDLGSGTKDDSDAAPKVFDYGYGGTSSGNINENVETPIAADTPPEGVGYYLIPYDADDGYLYSNGYHMDSRVNTAGNIAVLSNVYLTAGTKFKIKNHYYAKPDHDVETKDVEQDLTLGDGIGTYLSKSGTEYTVQAGKTATYNVYINGQSKLYLSHVSNSRVLSRRPTPNAKSNGPTKKSAGSLNGKSPNYIYLQVHSSSWWKSDSAWFACRFATTSSCYWIKMTSVFSDVNLHRTTIPDGSWTSVTFYRMNPNASEDVNIDDQTNKNNSWNNSGAQTLSSASNNCWVINSSSSGSFGTWSGLNITGSFNSWNTTKMGLDVADASGLLARKTGVSLSAGATFKVVKNNDWTGAYGWSTSYNLPSGCFAAENGNDGDNIKVNAGKGGSYNFYIDSSKNLVITPSTITVTLNKQSGSGGSSTVTPEYGFPMPSPGAAPTRTGYTFLGYFDASSGGTKYYNADCSSAKAWDVNAATKTLYAQWEPNDVTVTFNANGGQTPSLPSKTVTYDSEYGDLATTKRNGYVFAGWWTESSGGTEVTSSTTVTATSNHVLYAHWTELTLNVTLYVVCDIPSNGDGTYAYAWGSGYDYFVKLTTKATNYNNVYVATLPSTADGVIIYNGTSAEVDNGYQTSNIMLNGGADPFGRNRNAQNPENMVYVHAFKIGGSGDTKDNYKWSWMKFADAPASAGYYISTGSWMSANKMDVEHIGGYNLAAKQAFAVSAITFQIWHYDSSNNWTVYGTRDTGSTSTATYASQNLASAGTYDFYLTRNSEILVTTGYVAKLCFSKLNGVSSETERTMTMGDHPEGGTGFNRFNYEAALTVQAEDEFCLSFASGATSGYRGTGQVAIADAAAPFLEEGATAHGVTQYKFKASGQFTFYWTKDDTLSVAPIPELGYGYYLLQNEAKGAISSTNLPVFSYNKCLKMKTVHGGTNLACYYNYYAAAGEYIALRSYVDNLDTYYTNSNTYYDPGSGASQITTSSTPVRKCNIEAAQMTDAINSANSHGIVIQTAGYYNIFLNSSGQIDITKPTTTAADFNKLNSIDTGDTTAKKVRDRNTSFILKINFTTTTPIASEIWLDIVGSGSGLSTKLVFCVSGIDPDIGKDSPYDYMRRIAYTSLTGDATPTGTAMTGTTLSLQAGGSDAKAASGEHVVYVFMDYDPADVSGLRSSISSDFKMYLRAKQPAD